MPALHYCDERKARAFNATSSVASFSLAQGKGEIRPFLWTLPRACRYSLLFDIVVNERLRFAAHCNAPRDRPASAYRFSKKNCPLKSLLRKWNLSNEILNKDIPYMLHRLGNSRIHGLLDAVGHALELAQRPRKIFIADADFNHVSSRCGTG